MLKRCGRCKVDKSLGSFNKNKSKKCGLQDYCRSCGNMVNIEYFKTYAGKISRMYNSATSRCRNKSHYKNRKVDFKRGEFNEWIKTSTYDELYVKWVKSGYKVKLSPSIDRIDNNKGYVLDNIQIITFSENVKKDNRGEKNSAAKLTRKQVLSIRGLHKTGEYLQRELGEAFGVGQSHIGNIINKRVWKHI